MNRAAVNIPVQLSCGRMFSFLLSIYLGVTSLGPVVTLCLTFKELLSCSPQQLHSSTFPPAVHEDAPSPHPQQHVLTLDYRHPGAREVTFQCALTCVSLMKNEAGRLLMCPLAICISRNFYLYSLSIS